MTSKPAQFPSFIMVSPLSCNGTQDDMLKIKAMEIQAASTREPLGWERKNEIT
jgi:hypothetical protein